MRDGGRLAAAIAVLAQMADRHQPAHLALKAWAVGARYAGARDRAFISGLVLDALRRRRSLGWRMGDDSDRGAVLGVLRLDWDWPPERIAAAAQEEHGPGALTPAEAERLADPRRLDDAPAPVRGDYPDWIQPMMARVYGDRAAEEGRALAARAPVDLRVNTLKADPDKVLKALESFAVAPAGALPTALRAPPPAPSERAAAVEVAPAFERGWFEVQDLGSQIAADTAGDIRGKQVLDYCAGGGGKTLALAAAMGGKGQIYAYDSDPRRLTDTVRRSQRAGVRNLQVRSPIDKGALDGLEGRMDLVFADAPCTGSGTWRRHPDAKWRLGPEQLKRRMAEQDAVLDGAAAYVKPGGRLVYVTCSLFAEENEDRLAAFLARSPGFAPDGPWRRLTPLGDGTDGFFIARLVRG